jgi:hypothetical protein
VAELEVGRAVEHAVDLVHGVLEAALAQVHDRAHERTLDVVHECGRGAQRPSAAAVGEREGAHAEAGE